ncbi:CRISPR-associated endonuclease/helicase Cas3 [Clostridium acetireducens DSM 10703]|uniref:CRISPR-associated endonuclease/helicase Cas3 n=1 Tax=Clostridium acetireducens DSM 10703 TaxID=1121290 RepID=A0A1E8EWX9_9CLOT|nr:CRISPR-associated helicase/endonuclease Cas3 [Clostridium acetireducens]OFI05278.1 CRISPR-associated endonuclease/helicase Cas3 [Clostridium acetireducens DSM 10703]
MEFYSHPNKFLIDHLKEVNEYMKDSLSLNYGEESKIIAFSHDFGKYTTYFQKYLFEEKYKDSLLSNHGFISAIFGAYIALDKFGEDSILPLIVYSSILHHHGSLKNIELNLPKTMRGIKSTDSSYLIDKIEIGEKQIENIRKNKTDISKDYESIGYDKYFNSFINDINIEKILCKLKRMEMMIKRKYKSSELYFSHQLQYSALIASDKISAANIKLPSLKYVNYEEMDKVRRYKIGESKSEINKIRTDIFNIVQDEIKKSYREHKIFSITAPTGTGKTYSGFFAALKLRELLKDNRRIIYALPFTSIINQNFDVLYDLFCNVKDFENKSSDYIIKHHSMADVEYNSEKENYKSMEAELLLENWDSPIVITTFVQLLQTLIGNKNRMLKKFNALKNSIILLDEVQAIDIKYYELVDYILKEASKYLDCRIIMMTATKPILLQDSKELLKHNEDYFKLFNRTKIIPKINKVTVEDFIEEFLQHIEYKSYLIICNTIDQSIKIYNSLKNIDREVYYLSTNLIPLHRKRVIDSINEKLNKGEKPILVSTQVVEAGVDFDFNVVIRDIAPISSIIQSAGRCNRHNKSKGDGQVYIYSMVDNSSNYYGRYVYGTSNINISKDILQHSQCIEEKEYLDLINKYFKEINENINKDISEKLIESIENLYFSKQNEKYTLSKFSLIENNPNYMEVFIRIDDKAERVYEKLMGVLKEKDENIKREGFIKIKNKIRDYTLSIPMKYKSKFNIDEYTRIVSLPMEGCENYYDINTGFIREDKEDYFIF